MNKPPVTPEIYEEFERFKFLIERLEEFDKPARIKIIQEWIDFMKKYQPEFTFSDERIAKSEKQLAAYVASVEKTRRAELRHAALKREEEQAVAALDEALVVAAKQKGKPVAIPAYQSKKRNSGN